jgi:hypothetical protein
MICRRHAASAPAHGASTVWSFLRAEMHARRARVLRTFPGRVSLHSSPPTRTVICTWSVPSRRTRQTRQHGECHLDLPSTAPSRRPNVPVFGSVATGRAPASALRGSRGTRDRGVSILFDRGRDGPLGPPPAQIRASGITALGSHLGFHRRCVPRNTDEGLAVSVAILEEENVYGQSGWPGVYDVLMQGATYTLARAP